LHRAFVGDVRAARRAPRYGVDDHRFVADPTPIARLAQPMKIGGATILVETPHQSWSTSSVAADRSEVAI